MDQTILVNNSSRFINWSKRFHLQPSFPLQKFFGSLTSNRLNDSVRKHAKDKFQAQAED